MAGLGKKTFTAGEVLTASDVNGYLMDQSIMVFGGTAARSSAIPSPSEGMMSYRTDDDVVEVFNGTDYVSVGGVAALKDADISGTTGSPGTATYTDGGINYKAYSFTGTGSITFTKQGLVDVLCVAGGGGISTLSSGGGAGGFIHKENYLVTATSITVTVGAGGAASNMGKNSVFDKLFSIGGGRADNGGSLNTAFGGSTGSNSANAANVPVTGQGNNGFQGLGGGGGSGGAGGASAGGVGTSNSITGSAVTYATGGPKSGGAGAANTGNGSGGTAATAGGSGIVIIRVLA